MQKNKAQIGKLVAQAASMLEGGLVEQADSGFRLVLSQDPKNPVALFSLAVIESNRLNFNKALAYLDRAVAAAPKSIDILYGRGLTLTKLGRRTEALACFDKILLWDPTNIRALNESAVVLHGLSRRGDAIERLEKSTSLEPKAASLNNLAAIQAESISSDDQQKSISTLQKLVSLQPDYPFAAGGLLYQQLHICDWSDFATTAPKVAQKLSSGWPICKPIPCMVMSSEAREHYLCAESFRKSFFTGDSTPLWKGEHYQNKKIRVGYVSPDLRDHPVGQLMIGILEKHDKTLFETFAFSTGPQIEGPVRTRMKACFDHFIEVDECSMVEVAKKIYELKIDIAIDLAGYTAGTGSQAFACRPAPIQVNFLGYPGTLGTDFMDYLIADVHVIPPAHQQFYTEKVVYLPDTYLPTDDSIQPSETTPGRQECGLPAEGFVFCAFSHDHKISPPVFDIWMRLLEKCPGSVLWLMSRLGVSQSNLLKECAARGVDPSRLVFAHRVPLLEDHLARYRLADVFLDTFPYNAHTTAADALLTGLPVLTCMGNAFPSRVAGSLLHAIGIPELITHSLTEYEAKALQLFNEPALLANLKSKLTHNKVTHPLFKTEQFCRNLESVFLKMYATKWGKPE